MADDRRSAEIPAPTQPAITWRGQKVTPAMIVELDRAARRAKQQSRKRILLARAMRRKDPSSLVRLNAKWRRKFPEAAAVAALTSEHRVTLERNLIAAVGAVEPEFEREPLGFKPTDREYAEQCQSYLEEWRLRCVPAPSFVGKQVEDGEHALVVLPCDLDMDGCPDYYEYLDEAAHEKLSDDEKERYSQDDDDRRRRYVKRDRDGKRVPRAPYASLLDESDDDKKKPAPEREKARDARHKAARDAHDEDVMQYILRKQLDASAVRLIPALDCAPVFRRGKRRDRWELVALVERVLYEPWDLLDAKDGYRWQHLGDRKLIPLAYGSDGKQLGDGETGVNGQVYVYTAYLPVKDDEGRTRIKLCTTVGGAATWDSQSGRENDPDSVSVVDLYDEYGVEGEQGGLWPFVTYHGGLHTEDDDPDQYWQPYLTALIDRIKAIEASAGALRAAVSLLAFTGHFYSPDPRWASTEDGMEAILDTEGELRRPRMPGPGEIEQGGGIITPAQQAQIGQDAWRLLEMDQRALAEATAIDQIPGGSGDASGHSLLVQATLGQVAKRHIREGVLGAVVAAGEAHLRTLDAIYRKYKIRWPIRTVQERPMEGEPQTGRAPAMFDPAWVQDGQFNLSASYPEESNIAMVDLEANLYERGLGSFDDVQRARGKRDSDAERLKIDKDRLLKTPAADALRLRRVAKKIGDPDLQAIADLQAQELMAPDVPGVPGGVPSAALKRGAQQGMTSGGSMPNIAASARGGEMAADQGAATLQANAQAALTGGAAA